jgi:von Willebrand factor type A domain/Dockerin type I domain
VKITQGTRKPVSVNNEQRGVVQILTFVRRIKINLKGGWLMKRLTILCLVVFVLPLNLFAAEVVTDSTAYAPFDLVSIDGSGFQANETVTLQVTQNNGEPIEGEAGDTWTATADEYGNIQSDWLAPTIYQETDTLQLNGLGESSYQEDETVFLVSIQKKFHHLQNGTGSSSANWANGNINSSNSCYAEASSVPYRYFIKGLTANSEHYFTIDMGWTKGGIHGFDYLTDYNLTEAAGIATAGGTCGTSSTTPPADCSAISGTFAFPDPTNTANYSGTIPPDFFPAGFTLDGPRNLSFYNVVVDSISKYVFGGTASDRNLSFKVYFTVTSTASVGFYWGGHTAEGTADTWGLGNGSGSISGAPIHMDAGILDGSGGTIGRSLQSGSICNPPDPAITCDSDSVCIDSTYTCTAAAGAYDYDWNITGGTIISGQGTETISYTVSATYPGTVTITLDACNQSDGCADYLCCTYDEITLPVGNCCDPPFAACPNDTTIFACDLSTICLSGFSCSGGTATVIGGTLTGSQVCFTPVPGVNTITYICANDCGVADTCSVDVTIVQNSEPTCNVPNDTTIFQCTPTQVNLPVTAADVDNNLSGCTVVSGPGTIVGGNWQYTPTGDEVVNVTVRCTDDCGAYCEGSFQVTFDINEAPVCTIPGDQTFFVCQDTTFNFMVSATDADNNLVGCSKTSGPGTLTAGVWSFTATTTGVYTAVFECIDQCQATCGGTVNITVNYNAPPQITCPQNTSVSCEASTDPSNTGYATATDDHGPAPTITYSDTEVTGQCPQEKIITREWVAVDECDAADTCYQTINVTDDIAPVITCPASLTIDCAASTDPSNTGYATATDNCDPSPVVTYADVQTGDVITRTWTATDACDNSDQCVQTITIEDNTDPTITCPDDIGLQCSAQIPEPSFGSVIVSDDCDPQPVVIHVSDVSDGNTCPEIITRTYRATDASGNFAECTQTITVDDDTDPVITCPQSLTIDCAASTDPSNTGYAAATDNCDPDPVITYADVQVGEVITRTWTATDDCDNSDQCVQTITLDDTTPPEITCPDDVDIQCGGDVPSANFNGLVATDDCDPNPVVTFEGDVSDGNTCPEVITRTYRATDYSGNFAECTQIITIDDDIPPEITCPANITLDCTEPTDPSHTGTATATDNCDADPDITYADVEVNGSITRTWTATDECDNTDECVQTITIEENDTPVCILPDDQEFFVCDDTTFTFSVSATDNHEVTCIMSTGDGTFDGSTWTFTTSGDGVYSGTFVCTDVCDAYCEGTVNITVMYNTAPVCFVPADDAIMQCGPQEVCYPVYAEDAEDNLVGCEVVSGPGEIINGEWCYTPEGTETANVTVLCTDVCGATCEESFTIEFTVIENWAVLLIDRTGSMYLEDLGGNSRFDRAKSAALADVDKLLDEFDGDFPGVFEVAVMSFNSLDGIQLEQDFTSNASLLINAINNIADPAFNTPLAAAMCQAACYMPELPGCNNHMFTYTDGLENKSYVFDMCTLCVPCDTYVGTGWNYDCDPSSPSTCTDWQMCLFDVFTNNAINTTYYFGEPINPFGKSNPPEDMYFMKAVAELSSGEFSYFSDLEAPPYACGDANTDFAVNVSDAVFIINYVFVGGEAPAPLYIADANCDDAVNVSDAVYVINYVFVGGPVPCYDCPIFVK